jgi:hypothetical protein
MFDLQAVEEQLDLQMIVDGNTEVILEAYTKESDGGKCMVKLYCLK